MRWLIFFVCFVSAATIGLVAYTRYINKEKIEYLNNEVNSFEVVVARYNEDLSWIEKEFPNDKITIYNKGKNDISVHSGVTIKKLENIGRESHTYINYIIENYDNLPDRVLFLQGNPFTHMNFTFKPLSVYKKIKQSNCKNIVAKGCFFTNTGKQRNILIDLKQTRWQDTVYKNLDFADFKDQYVDIDSFAEEYFFTNLEANFAVDKCRIIARPKKYYINLISLLDNNAPIEGHYLERLWDIVFSQVKPSCKLPS
jgi:hypothetical protein